MIHAERIHGVLEFIQTSIAGTERHPVMWGIAWRDAMQRINVRLVLKSCRELEFEGSDSEKREARVVGRLVRRGREYARQVSEVERDIGDLYPANQARQRLDDELGWTHSEDDSFATKLDRICMISRVNAPPIVELRRRAHATVRARFDDLEVVEAAL